MRYVYEALVSKDEDSYLLEVPDLPGCFTWADSIEDVVRKAPDALETHVGSYLAAAEPVPPATFGHEAGPSETLIVVAFDATAASVGAPCVMASTAAQRLGVTPARISHLLRDGKLEGYRTGRETMITVASIERYERTPRKSGRPRKVVTA
ncbi:MAG: type II toxin-antitoxin system HicB family antitoxin [Coriobacteriales bacterium]|jgi:predicted RNase H-like HicB family nuclease|nr:type II toxin-antitoxin system HicB family antitoxin [Coriobacteriales bacterium]